MASIEIVGSEKAFSARPERQGKVDRLVLYRVEGDPALRFVDVPDETFTMQAAQDAIRKFEAERRLTQPVRFQI